MKLTKKILSLALVTAMAAGMVSGCGGGGKTADPTTAAQTKEAAGSEAAGSEAAGSEAAGSEAAPGEVSEGGSLTIAIPQPHNTFFMPQSTTTGDRFGAQPVLESLGRADTEGNYYPWLAEEFVTDAENLTFTIKLREGVKFHDGSDLSAEVVAWNIPTGPRAARSTTAVPTPATAAGGKCPP